MLDVRRMAPWAWHVVAGAVLVIAIIQTANRRKDRETQANRFRRRAELRGAVQRLGGDVR